MEGSDSKGATYANPEALWAAELKSTGEEGKPAFFTTAIDYWGTVPASVDGVLGVRVRLRCRHKDSWIFLLFIILKINTEIKLIAQVAITHIIISIRHLHICFYPRQ